MAKGAHLNPNEKKFFATDILEAVTNPFSKARLVIDLKISGMPPETSRDDLIEGSLPRGENACSGCMTRGEPTFGSIRVNTGGVPNGLYIKEFREEAVKLVTEGGFSVRGVASTWPAEINARELSKG